MLTAVFSLDDDGRRTRSAAQYNVMPGRLDVALRPLTPLPSDDAKRLRGNRPTQTPLVRELAVLGSQRTASVRCEFVNLLFVQCEWLDLVRRR